MNKKLKFALKAVNHQYGKDWYNEPADHGQDGFYVAKELLRSFLGGPIFIHADDGMIFAEIDGKWCKARLKPKNKPASNVIDLPVVTTLDLNADKVLKQARGNLESVVVLGYGKDGEEYFASSIADGADVVWLMERLKKILLAVVDDAIE